MANARDPGSAGRAGGPRPPRGRRARPHQERPRRAGRGCCSHPPSLVLAVLLLWPLVRVVLFSLQDYGLREIVSGEPNWIGLANFGEIFTDPAAVAPSYCPTPWCFAVLAVACTVVLGTPSPCSWPRLGAVWRTVVSSAIMIAWAMPAVTGTYVWVWIFDADARHRQRDPRRRSGCRRARQLVHEPLHLLRDRAPQRRPPRLPVRGHHDPRGPARRAARRCSRPPRWTAPGPGAASGPIIVPNLKQVFAVVIILSTIWDFKVFAQVYLMPGGAGSNREALNLGVWSYVESFGQNRYGFGSAIAVLLTLVLLGHHRRVRAHHAEGGRAVTADTAVRTDASAPATATAAPADARPARPAPPLARPCSSCCCSDSRLFPAFWMLSSAFDAQAGAGGQQPAAARVVARQLRVRAHRGRIRRVPAQLGHRRARHGARERPARAAGRRSPSPGSASSSAPRCC